MGSVPQIFFHGKGAAIFLEFRHIGGGAHLLNMKQLAGHQTQHGILRAGGEDVMT
jgi:hypothetical protein